MSNCPIRTAELHVTDSPDCVNDVQYLIKEGLARVLKVFFLNSSPFYGVHNVTLHLFYFVLIKPAMAISELEAKATVKSPSKTQARSSTHSHPKVYRRIINSCHLRAAIIDLRIEVGEVQ